MDTTIKIHENTKQELDTFREYLNESYDEVIKKVVFIAKTSQTQPRLSKETMKSIEQARERIKKGKFLIARIDTFWTMNKMKILPRNQALFQNRP